MGDVSQDLLSSSSSPVPADDEAGTSTSAWIDKGANTGFIHSILAGRRRQKHLQDANNSTDPRLCLVSISAGGGRSSSSSRPIIVPASSTSTGPSSSSAKAGGICVGNNKAVGWKQHPHHQQQQHPGPANSTSAGNKKNPAPHNVNNKSHHQHHHQECPCLHTSADCDPAALTSLLQARVCGTAEATTVAAQQQQPPDTPAINNKVISVGGRGQRLEPPSPPPPPHSSPQEEPTPSSSLSSPDTVRQSGIKGRSNLSNKSVRGSEVELDIDAEEEEDENEEEEEDGVKRRRGVGDDGSNNNLRGRRIRTRRTRAGRIVDRIMKCPGWLRKNGLTIATVSGVLGGVAFGFILRASREEKWSAREAMYVSYVGELFLRMLKCLILPLIVSSLISAVGGLDLTLSGKIGLRAVAYYMLTTVMAVILGLILVSTIHPGQGNADDIHQEGGVRNITTADTLMDLVRNIFPPNVVQAAVFSYRTKLIPPPAPAAPSDDEYLDRFSPGVGGSTSSRSPITSLYDLSSETPELASGQGTPSYYEKQASLYDWEIKGAYEEGTNIMGLVMFSFVLGITLCKMGPKGKPLHDFFASMAEAMMLITNWVIWMSPIGVFFLIAGQLLEMNDFGVIVGQLGMYFVTVLIGLFFHGFIVLPTIYGVATRTLPFRFVLNMMEAVTTAFGTASSSATLPVTYRCLENRNHVDPRISRFVLPIGATINMDGTALYEAVAALFIAQVRGMSLGIGSVIAISITATAASIGAAGIPQAGLVTLVMVLDTVGLPAEDVSLIVAVDWLLDRFRTAINVLGDALGAGIVAHLSQKELDDSTAAHKSRSSGGGGGGAGEMYDEDDWNNINGEKYNRATHSDVEAARHVELTAM